jgi:radical SAM superfamily enzyme YgiQ (UPF0313 family)
MEEIQKQGISDPDSTLRVTLSSENSLVEAIKLAFQLYASGDLPGARSVCDQLLSDRVEHFYLYFVSGIVAYQVNDWALAQNHLQAAMRLSEGAPSDKVADITLRLRSITELQLIKAESPFNKIKIGFCYVVDGIDYNPGFRPIGFSYLKSSIENQLPDMFDFTYFENYSDNSYDIILVSSLSPNWSSALEIIKKFRKNDPQVKIIVGGQHISQLPMLLPDEADFGILREGEVSAPRLLELIVNNSTDMELYKQIDGIVFKNGIDFYISEPKRLKFDAIPHPDRLFQDGDKIVPYLLTSRGCPFYCTFCSSANFWRTVSMQSAESIADEIESIAKNFPNLQALSIWDDLFIADRKRLVLLSELLQQKGLLNRFRLNCNVRADLVDNNLCELLRKLNVTSCGFGFEHGVDRLLKLLKPEGKCTVEKNIETAKLLSDQGFGVGIGIVFGAPSETEEDVVQTFELTQGLLKRGVITSIAYNVLMPMPGTYYWNEALKMGLVAESNDFDWNKLSVFADSRFSTCGSFDNWVKERRKRNSVYLNESFLPEKKLFEIMARYYR